MSEIIEWMKDKPLEISLTAVTIANSSEEVSQTLTEMREQADVEISQPPLKQWLKFYTNHNLITDQIANLFTSDGSEKLFSELYGGEEFDFTPQEKEHFLQLYKKPETLFFFKVWAPCLIHYKTTSTQLFRDARLGKISAFEKLLRLDNSVVFDKRLAEIFHKHKGQTNKQNYRKLLQAFSKPVTKKTDPKHVKSIAAGLISFMTEAMGNRLTEPQIRELFDAIAKDNAQGLQDEDLPSSSDTFAQAIRRESKKIKATDKRPDKK